MTRRMLITFTLYIALCGCTPGEEALPDHSATPGDSQILEVDEIGATEALAANGDVDAARRLVQYYVLGDADREKAMRWQRVAIDLGDESMKLNLATYLALSGSQADCRQAEALLQGLGDQSQTGDLASRSRQALNTLKYGFEGEGPCVRWLTTREAEGAR